MPDMDGMMQRNTRFNGYFSCFGGILFEELPFGPLLNSRCVRGWFEILFEVDTQNGILRRKCPVHHLCGLFFAIRCSSSATSSLCPNDCLVRTYELQLTGFRKSRSRDWYRSAMWPGTICTRMSAIRLVHILSGVPGFPCLLLWRSPSLWSVIE